MTMHSTTNILAFALLLPQAAGLGLVDQSAERRFFPAPYGNASFTNEQLSVPVATASKCPHVFFSGREYMQPYGDYTQPPYVVAHEDAELQLYSDGTGYYRACGYCEKRKLNSEDLFCNENMFFGKMEWLDDQYGFGSALHCYFDFSNNGSNALCTFYGKHDPNNKIPHINSPSYRFESGNISTIGAHVSHPEIVPDLGCKCGFFDSPEGHYRGTDYALFPTLKVHEGSSIEPKSEDPRWTAGPCGTFNSGTDSSPWTNHYMNTQSCNSMHYYGMLQFQDNSWSQFHCTKIGTSRLSQSLICSFNFLRDYYFVSDGIAGAPIGEWQLKATGGTQIKYTVTTGMSWSTGHTVTETDKVAVSTAATFGAKFQLEGIGGVSEQFSLTTNIETDMANAVSNTQTFTSEESCLAQCDALKLPEGHTEWWIYQWNINADMFRTEPKMEAAVLNSKPSCHLKCIPNKMEPKCPFTCCKTGDDFCQECDDCLIE